MLGRSRMGGICLLLPMKDKMGRPFITRSIGTAVSRQGEKQIVLDLHRTLPSNKHFRLDASGVHCWHIGTLALPLPPSLSPFPPPPLSLSLPLSPSLSFPPPFLLPPLDYISLTSFIVFLEHTATTTGNVGYCQVRPNDYHMTIM